MQTSSACNGEQRPCGEDGCGGGGGDPPPAALQAAPPPGATCMKCRKAPAEVRLHCQTGSGRSERMADGECQRLAALQP